MKSITVEKLLGNNKNYQQVTGNEESLKRVILTGEINRPGFELAGFFKHSDFRRIIVFGDKEMAFISKKIATIYREVPLNIVLEDLKYEQKVTNELVELFKDLEFFSFLKNMEVKKEEKSF